MSANTTEAIDLLAGNVLAIGVFGVLSLLALGITATMFITRERMLGFPCVIFWAILGAYAYTESTAAWADWQYYLFFCSLFGMTVFCAIAAFGLREKHDAIADEEMEKGEGEYVGEGKEEPEPEPSSRAKRLHARADARRKRLK